MVGDTPESARLRALVLRPSETLNAEYKRWLDPDEPPAAAKIVRALLALRNRNGGSLVIGFDDKTMQPLDQDVPSDVRAAFHTDKIQGLISRYASDLYEVRIDFEEREERLHPIITVPEGVRTVVAAKNSFVVAGETIIKVGDVYFRSLSANGTPSTSLIRPGDWVEIMEICFENREADIGRFLRRHLSHIDLSKMISELQGASAASIQSAPNLKEHCLSLLSQGETSFREALTKRLPKEQERLSQLGTWSVALVIDPQRSDSIPDKAFKATLASSNPGYTGWPIWLDSSNFADPSDRPYISQNAVEALIASIDEGWPKSSNVDFMRINPSGKFYLLRVLQDDLSDKIKPRMFLDPILALLRVTEAMAVGLSFASALGWDAEDARLGFAFKWSNIADRKLSFWASPEYVGVPPPGQSHDNEALTFVELPLDTPISALAPYVRQAINGLSVLFDGYTLSSEVVEYWVQRLVGRAL